MIDNAVVPCWVEAQLFENVVREKFHNFKEIINFQVGPALAPGENYSTVMLKIQLKVLLTDGSKAMQNLMMKVPHDNELYRKEMYKFEMFATESLMYCEIVRELERLYADAGVTVELSAKSHRLPIDKEYVLLDDLKDRHFRNVKRQSGLDREHCQSVLRKLALWHAASAVRMQRVGLYSSKRVKGVTNEIGYDVMRKVMQQFINNVLKSAKTLKNQSVYYAQMEKFSPKFIEIFFKKETNDDFKVLNHGDCWSNNLMFQYNTEGQLTDMLFVDLQFPRYGNPAQDLLYFIFTSAKLELKIQCFDELIKYYYDHLVASLKLLNYPKTLPSLGDLHKQLIEGAIWAMFAAWNILPVVLVESHEDAHIDNLVGDTMEGDQFKELMFANEIYRQHLEQILPWLYYRGAFDCE